MPNDITNVLKFDCSIEKMEEIGNYLMGPEGKFFGVVDFNTLDPMPEGMDIEASFRGNTGYRAYKNFIEEISGSSADEMHTLEEKYKEQFKYDPEIWELGKQYFQNFCFYGATNGYVWCNEHWNTNRNAYNCVETLPREKMLIFHTEWADVIPVVKILSWDYPDITISYGWADEEIGYNVGCIKLRNGEITEKTIPEGGSREAYKMAADIMRYDIS